MVWNKDSDNFSPSFRTTLAAYGISDIQKFGMTSRSGRSLVRTCRILNPVPPRGGSEKGFQSGPGDSANAD